jgi:hypothetical protein
VRQHRRSDNNDDDGALKDVAVLYCDIAGYFTTDPASSMLFELFYVV